MAAMPMLTLAMLIAGASTQRPTSGSRTSTLDRWQLLPRPPTAYSLPSSTAKLRLYRAVASGGPAAHAELLDRLGATKTNDEFLREVAKLASAS